MIGRSIGMGVVAAAIGVFAATLLAPGAGVARPPLDSSSQCLPASVTQGADVVMLMQYGGQGPSAPYQVYGDTANRVDPVFINQICRITEI